MEDSLTFQLSDGRTLGFAEYGSPTGDPIFHFHGFPSSRLEGILVATYAKDARIITIDRPGMGFSTFQPDRHFLDWPKDVLDLADHLKIDQFRVLGLSGGSPYALACAKEIPRSRLLAVAVVGGVYPLNLGTEGMLMAGRILFYVAGSWMSPIVKLLLDWEMGNLARNPDPEVFRKAFLKEMSGRPEPDRKCLENEFTAHHLIESCRESFIQGGDGVAHEAKLYARAWDFELEEVDFDGLFLWHGGADINAPVSMLKKAAAKLKGSQCIILDQETHMSLPVNHAGEILKRLLATTPKEQCIEVST